MSEKASGPVWSAREIEKEKARARAELDALSEARAPGSRLQAALQRIDGLAEDDTDRGRIRRYIFIMSALVQHERSGGLTMRQVDRLVDLASGILRAQNIKPRSSKIASLYGDLHLIRSQINRKAGMQWQAAWEQQVALQLSGAYPSGGIGFQEYAMGNRVLRLGHAGMAAGQFSSALRNGLPDHQADRARFGLILSAWLSGKAPEAEKVLRKQSTHISHDSAVIDELAWHRMVRAAQKTGDFSTLLAEVRKGRRFHLASYMLEACMWCYTTETRSWLARVPRLESMRRNQYLNPQQLGIFYEAALVLQQCYDYTIPAPVRLESLSRILEQRSSILNVDKELLVLAAATRWLARSKMPSLALLVFNEFRAVNLRLSDGGHDDVLCLLPDMKERDWAR